MKDIVDEVTDMVKPIDGVLAKVLTHPFKLLSPGSSLPSGILAAHIS